MPMHYEKNYRYPLVVWLHSDMETSDEIHQVMPKLSMRNCVAVAPNCSNGGRWQQDLDSIEAAHTAVINSVEMAMTRFSINPGRIFIGGFGGGGTMAFRVAMERQLHERPTVTSLARALGYSTRTLDRACVEASGHTAKYLLDERVALEVRRLLTYSNRSVAQIATSLGFADASNFSKFVKRQLGEGPLEIRAAGTAAENS